MIDCLVKLETYDAVFVTDNRKTNYIDMAIHVCELYTSIFYQDILLIYATYCQLKTF